MKNLCTETQLVQKVFVAIEKMSAMDKARLRIEMRKFYGLPAQPEPDARIN